jgi:molecular chaperone GrpE (heat shock protein)
VDVDVEEITGIALGNSEIVKPGFAGATLLASLQEFADNAGHEKPPKEGDKPMTKEEIRQAIRDSKFKPSDLFGSAEMSDDPIVQEVIREKRRNEEGFEGRQSAKLEAQVKKLEDDNKALQAKLEASSRITLKTKAADAIKPAIEKRKLDEKQSAFILKHADKFTPTTEESLAGDLDKFLDAQLDVFKSVTEIYGIKPGEGGAAGVGAGKAGDTSVDDLLTPDNLKDAPKK